ncbi:MAG: hypothetical protein QOJ65_1523 [Fimbriimonadaceae bacterium]|jgi:hypothetical protein|nr:hypothetical protein [Fimbriimonadaceae bacterium]
MGFRSKDEVGTAAATLVGIVVLIGAIAFMVLAPKPTTKGLVAAQRREESTILKDISKAHATLAASQTDVQSQTWKGAAQDVGAGALKQMNALALAHKVKLSGFRPQRSSTTAGLELIPYSMTAEGSFTDVLRFVKAIENPDTKLTVNLVQIGSSEANTDQVTASIGITAYRAVEEAKHA